MSAFDDYLAQLRRLDETRRSADEAATLAASRTESLGQRAERLAQQATAQRAAVDELAGTARVAPPPRTTAQPLGGDAATEIGAAEADLRTAAVEFEEARFLAYRPPWLPRWRTDERNGLLYGLFALASLLVQFTVLRIWHGLSPTDQFGAEVTVGIATQLLFIAIVVFIPLLTFGLAWLTIGVAGRPAIADDEKRLERNYRLGLVVCCSTLIVAAMGYLG
ncbi:hypothetical protein L0U85_00740 [Glycomyces sp. L485]|uniref:hypothetical protein n=1 Tax=Glycomyces sp. L485 TaxID=2909235 RepID=UPI001F4B81E1|nr:hypothetical protein [Glycomyces sp. L485]MCH7229396.1 hypothetical protein [Glycomyces sp. L485]